MYLHTLKIKKKAITTVIACNDGEKYKMKKGDKVEFVLFSEKLTGENHRVNTKDKTFNVIVEGIIYPNAKAYAKNGYVKPTSRRKTTKDLTPWYILN